MIMTLPTATVDGLMGDVARDRLVWWAVDCSSVTVFVYSRSLISLALIIDEGYVVNDYVTD